MAERTYLSIGDVLSLLKDEFPDITISKIRFLESQGLLDPERTPSGYRKFYEEDVDRLRWILRQQRENFLPLKVIKGRLGGNGGSAGGRSPDPEAADHGATASSGWGVAVARTASGSRSATAVTSTIGPRGAGSPGTPAPDGRLDPAEAADELELDAQEAAGPEPTVREPTAQEPTAQTPMMSPAPTSPGARSRHGVASPRRGGRPGAASAPATEARARGGFPGRSTPPTVRPEGRRQDAGGPEGRPEGTAGPEGGRQDAAAPGGPPQGAAAPGGQPQDVARPAGRPGQAVDRGGRSEDTAGGRARRAESGRSQRTTQERPAEDETGGPLSIGLSGVNLTPEELAGASGLSEEELRELERYGLLAGRTVGDTIYFDEESLTVARLAAGFRRFGIEARHLRMYRTAADREASFFEQIVMPLLKQRNPVARRRAVETLAELARLGQGLRGSLLRSALKDNTGG